MKLSPLGKLLLGESHGLPSPADRVSDNHSWLGTGWHVANRTNVRVIKPQSIACILD
jgi:hypothetical protein